MRKSIVGAVQAAPQTEAEWLPLDQVTAVEVTSEEAAQPVEFALLPGAGAGWRAAQPGEQTVRLIFDEARQLTRIRLLIVEREVERAQEFVLRWSADGGRAWQEIVRQQWHFSPHGATQELEDYQVDLAGVTQLELSIVPERSGGDARATLAELRVA